MRCAGFCPRSAIEAGHSWAVTLYLVVTIPAFSLFLQGLSRWIPGASSWESHWIAYVVALAWLYLSLALAYRLFHELLRLPLVNQLFAYTTLTHAPFWGRYREPTAKLRQLTHRQPPP